MRRALAACAAIASFATILLVAGHATAQPSPPPPVTWASLDPGDDWAAMVIRSIFPIPGMEPGEDTGTATTVIGMIVGQFTGFISAIAAAFVCYIVLMNIFRGAETSRILGSNQSWIAIVRISAAAILMFPAAGGFSAGQALVMHGALMGVGMARNVYTSAIQAVGPDAVTIARPFIPGTQHIVASLIESEMCMQLINRATNTGEFSSGPTVAPPMVPIPTPVTIARGEDGGTVAWNYHLSTGNRRGTPVCGSVTLQAPSTGSTTVAGVPTDMAAIQRGILGSVLNGEIRPQVRDIAGEFWETRRAISLLALRDVLDRATETYTNQLIAIGNTITTQLNDAVLAHAERMRLGDSNLLTGQIQQSTLGWASAGAYYLQIARVNAASLSLLSNTPLVTGPTYQGLDRRLSNDLATHVGPLRRFMDELQLVAQTRDGTRSPSGIPTTLAQAREGEGPGVLERVLRSIGLGDGFVATMAEAMLPTARVWTDPFGGLMELGQTLINASLGALAAAALLNSPVTAGGTAIVNFLTLNWGASAAAAGGYALMQMLGTPIFLGVLAILVPGLIIAFVLPLIPWVMWIAGVTGWIILVIEAMIAVPLWMLAHMTLGGQGLHGRATEGWGLLFSVIFRPVAMVIGLFCGYFVFAAISWLIRMTFGTAAGFALANGWLVANMVGMTVLLWIFVTTHIVAAMMSFRLIAQLPQHLPRLIGFNGTGRVDHDDFTYRAANQPGDEVARGTADALGSAGKALPGARGGGYRSGTPGGQVVAQGEAGRRGTRTEGLDSTLSAISEHRQGRNRDAD